MIGYIYLITNNINKKQYVGQTITTIRIRYNSHISDAKNKKDNMYVHFAMRKYGIDNFSVKEICTTEAENKKDLIMKLNELEIYYIAYYNTLAPNGYNLTKGGSEYPELYQRKVDEYDLFGNFIKTHSSIIDAAVSVGANFNTAIYKCCNGKSKFAFQRIWRYHGDPFDKYPAPTNIKVAQREYKNAPVDQYSKHGELIASFESISDVKSIFNFTINTSHISDCCNGKLHTSYGYVWRYKGEPFDKYTVKDNREVGCKIYDLNNNLLGTYSSIKEACQSIGLDHKKSNSHIVSCCKGKRKSAYGYIWKYIE